MKNHPNLLLPATTTTSEHKSCSGSSGQNRERQDLEADKENSVEPDPDKFSYRVNDKVEITAHLFEEIRRFIDEEIEKRPSIHPFLNILTYDTQRFHHIKGILDDVHRENVIKGNATPKEILERELQEFLAPLYESGRLEDPKK